MLAIWMPLVVISGLFQTLRNGAQRGLSDQAGPWGATLVRFAFGVPFTVLFVAAAYLLFPPVSPQFPPRFWAAAVVGATAQVLATAALLQAMRVSGFAPGTMFQHLALPITALFGAVVLGDRLGLSGWAGIGLATAGLVLASRPPQGLLPAVLGGPGSGVQGLKSVLFGVASGACFAVSANCYRICGTTLDPGSPFFSSTLTLLIIQTLQTVVLGAILLVADRGALRALRDDLKASLTAGFAGAAASLCWFAALTLAPAALVRAAAAVIDAPVAAVYGWVRFKERPDLAKVAGSVLIVAGVVLTVLAVG